MPFEVGLQGHCTKLVDGCHTWQSGFLSLLPQAKWPYSQHEPLEVPSADPAGVHPDVLPVPSLGGGGILLDKIASHVTPATLATAWMSYPYAPPAFRQWSQAARCGHGCAWKHSVARSSSVQQRTQLGDPGHCTVSTEASPSLWGVWRWGDLRSWHQLKDPVPSPCLSQPVPRKALLLLAAQAPFVSVFPPPTPAHAHAVFSYPK